MLVNNVDNGESYACVDSGAIWGISAPSSHIFCKPKTTLKKKIFKKMKNIKDVLLINEQ